MVRITDHQRINAVELRHDQLEDAKSVHLPQCPGRFGSHQYRAQPCPKARTILQAGRQSRNGGSNALLGCRRQRDARFRYEAERFQNDLRIRGRIKVRTRQLQV